MPRVLEIVLAAKDDYTPTLKKSFTDFVAWRKSIDAQMRSASHAKQYGGFEENFRAKFERDKEAAIKQQIEDSKKAIDDAGKNTDAWQKKLVNTALAIGGAKAGLIGVSALIQGINGDTDAVWAAFSRLPFGIGEVVSVARVLWETMTGTRKEAEKIAAAAAKKKELDSLAASTKETRTSVDADMMTARDLAHKRYGSTIDKMDEDFAKQAKGASVGELAGYVSTYNANERANKARLERDLTNIENDEREKARNARIAELDKEHRIEVDKYEKAVRQRQEIDRAANQQYLDELKARNEREDEDRKANYQDWVESLRPDELGGGSMGTVSAESVTGRFRGLAETSRNEALRVASETKNKIEEQNKILTQMLKLDEENGGALRRFFGSVGPL